MSSQRRFNACLVAAIVGIGAFGSNCIGTTPQDSAPEQTVRAGPIEATLKLDRSVLNPAQSLIATLTVRAASGVRVSLPPVEAKLGGFSVVSAVDEPLRTVSANSREEQVFERRYRLEPFLPGDYTLPPLEIRWQKSASESGVARTAEVKVSVESLLPREAGKDGKPLDPGTIRDAYTPPAERKVGAIWIGIAIGISVASVAGAGLWALGRKRHAADEVAGLLERVQAMRQVAGADAANPDALHELAAALRGALANRVEPSATTAETDVLVSRLGKSAAWGDSDAGRVGEVLCALDAARFGGISMPAAEFRHHVETVVGMLTRLRAMPQAMGGKR